MKSIIKLFFSLIIASAIGIGMAYLVRWPMNKNTNRVQIEQWCRTDTVYVKNGIALDTKIGAYKKCK